MLFNNKKPSKHTDSKEIAGVPTFIGEPDNLYQYMSDNNNTPSKSIKEIAGAVSGYTDAKETAKGTVGLSKYVIATAYGVGKNVHGAIESAKQGAGVRAQGYITTAEWYLSSLEEITKWVFTDIADILETAFMSLKKGKYKEAVAYLEQVHNIFEQKEKTSR
jgi:hypothetical protein